MQPDSTGTRLNCVPAVFFLLERKPALYIMWPLNLLHDIHLNTCHYMCFCFSDPIKIFFRPLGKLATLPDSLVGSGRGHPSPSSFPTPRRLQCLGSAPLALRYHGSSRYKFLHSPLLLEVSRFLKNL